MSSPAPESTRQWYRLITWPVLVPTFLFATGTGAMSPVLILAALQLGAGEVLASALIALVGLVALISTVPMGIVIDKVGDRRAMVLATATAGALIGLSVVALINAKQPWALWLFVASLLLRTPALSAWNLARQAVLAETVPTWFVGQAMTAMGGAMRAGALAGPLVGGALLFVWPLWSVFVFAVFCALAATALLFVRRFNDAFDAQTRRTSAARQETDVALNVRWGAVTVAGIGITTLAVARATSPVIIPLWGVHLGWHEGAISLLVALSAAIEMVLMVPGGYLKDQLGRSLILVVCLLVYGTGFLLIPLNPTSWGFIAAVAVMSVGNGLGAGINMTIGADLSPATGRARFLGIWAMFSQAGQLGGTAAVSALLAASGLPAAVMGVGFCAVTGAAWVAAWARYLQLPKGVTRS